MEPIQKTPLMRDEYSRRRNVGDFASNVIASMLTAGHFQWVSNLFNLVGMLGAHFVLPFLRYNFGTRSLSIPWLFFGGLTLSILLMIDATLEFASYWSKGMVESFNSHPFEIHRQYFIWISVAHMLKAFYDVHWKKEERYSYSNGRSLLFLLTRKIHHPFFQDEGKIMFFLEPLLVFFVALLFYYVGYQFYGNFLIFCSLSLFYLAYKEYNTAWNLVQDMIDANIVGETLLSDDTRQANKEKGYVPTFSVVKVADTFSRLEEESKNIFDTPEEGAAPVMSENGTDKPTPPNNTNGTVRIAHD